MKQSFLLLQTQNIKHRILERLRFTFTPNGNCRLLFITSTQKYVVSSQFYP